MALRWTLVVSTLVLAACTQSAVAQEGSGLYEPFPGPVTEERAVEFVRSLIISGDAEGGTPPPDARALDAGVPLDPGFQQAAEGAPSARAAAAAPDGGLAAATAAIAVLAGAGLVLTRRRSGT